MVNVTKPTYPKGKVTLPQKFSGAEGPVTFTGPARNPVDGKAWPPSKMLMRDAARSVGSSARVSEYYPSRIDIDAKGLMLTLIPDPGNIHQLDTGVAYPIAAYAHYLSNPNGEITLSVRDSTSNGTRGFPRWFSFERAAYDGVDDHATGCGVGGR